MLKFIATWLKNIAATKKLEKQLSVFFPFHEASYVSLSYRQQHDLRYDPRYIYGYLTLSGALQLRKAFKSSMQPDTIVDLGCGDARALFILLQLFAASHAIGFETIPPLVDLAQRNIDHLMKVGTCFNKKPIHVLAEDFFQFKPEVKTYLVYFNASGYFGTDFSKVIELFNKFQVGSYFVLISKQIEGECFEYIDSQSILCSWGYATANIYKKIK